MPEVRINMQYLQQIIATLKSLKVRGYDSMDKLVGLVILFENLANNAEEAQRQQAEVALHPVAETEEEE